MTRTEQLAAVLREAEQTALAHERLERMAEAAQRLMEQWKEEAK